MKKRMKENDNAEGIFRFKNSGTGEDMRNKLDQCNKDINNNYKIYKIKIDN